MKIVIKVPKQIRAHIVLFCKDTPFKPKRVENKKAFKRQSKHRNKEQ